jgi:SAM-dependent methyltransferase
MGGTPAPDAFLHGAGAYERHIGRYGVELAQESIKFADVRSGQRVLDVGCGPGALTRQLAVLLGAEHVAAIDPSPSFVQACRDRLPGVHAQVAAAEALPFADGVFDRVLAQLVMNFMTDAVAGVGEMCRVTRSGGMVASAVWDYAGQMTLLRRSGTLSQRWTRPLLTSTRAAPCGTAHPVNCKRCGRLPVSSRSGSLPLLSRPAMRDSRICGSRWSPGSLPRAPTWPRSRPTGGRH